MPQITPRLSFAFNESPGANTSAGVYDSQGRLIRTLWNGVRVREGHHQGYWDGLDDNGDLALDRAYKIRVLTSTFSYLWGKIGNSSTAPFGPTIYHMEDIAHDMACAGNYCYLACGYNEGKSGSAKFPADSPRSQTTIVPTDGFHTGAAVFHVATDGSKVYWAATDVGSPRQDKPPTFFVYVTDTHDDSPVQLEYGAQLTLFSGATYESAIDISHGSEGEISGIPVQRHGSFLFVVHDKQNEVHVLDKGTGALVKSFNLPAGLVDAGRIVLDSAGNLWMICTSGANRIVTMWKVNGQGDISATPTALTGLSNPLSLAISPDGSQLVVADGGQSQQLKAFSLLPQGFGKATWTLGQPGGNLLDPAVAVDKFFFSDSWPMCNFFCPKESTFVAFDKS